MVIYKIKNYIQHPHILPKMMLNHLAPLIKDEKTLIHWSGMVPFEPRDWDYKFGEWLTLPEPQRNHE